MFRSIAFLLVSGRIARSRNHPGTCRLWRRGREDGFSVPVTASSVIPLHTESGKRYLVDASGKP